MQRNGVGGRRASREGDLRHLGFISSSSRLTATAVIPGEDPSSDFPDITLYAERILFLFVLDLGVCFMRGVCVNFC